MPRRSQAKKKAVAPPIRPLPPSDLSNQSGSQAYVPTPLNDFEELTFIKANPTLDNLILDSGRLFPIVKGEFRIVKGSRPTVCPKAILSNITKSTILLHAPAFLEALRKHRLVKDGETFHYVGALRAGRYDRLCECYQEEIDQNHSEENTNLSELKKDILQVLIEAEAFNSDSKLTTLAIAKKAEGRTANVNKYKVPITELRNDGYVMTARGCSGGCWLTAKGRQRIKTE